MCALKSLSTRRENRSLMFAVKCSQHRTQKSMFHLNPTKDTHSIRTREKYLVNKARTETYFKSTIPYLQRRLNNHAEKRKEVQSLAHRKAPGRAPCSTGCGGAVRLSWPMFASSGCLFLQIYHQ